MALNRKPTALGTFVSYHPTDDQSLTSEQAWSEASVTPNTLVRMSDYINIF
jgi:hypothetical protein